MLQGVKFNAPWGKALKVMTGVSVLVLVHIPVIGMFTGPQGSIGWILGMIVTPLLTLTIAAFFMIRGYVLTADALLVQRLGWNSKLDLSGLISAEADPRAMEKSIRTFANGGLFCFAGFFRNKKLGSFRAFATDHKLSVVLRFKSRAVVVTPENPEHFVSSIRGLRNLQGAG